MSDSLDKQQLLDNIEFLIKERGMKIGEFETKTGVSLGYISRISKEGGSTPGLEFIINTAHVLGVSIDSLISSKMSELTPTEKYLVSFLEKLEQDTNEDKLDWHRESFESLNRIETDNGGNSEHPLFSYETFCEEIGLGRPQEISEFRFVSHSFDVHTMVHGDCFNFRMKNGTLLYVMNICRSEDFENDPNAYAKEVWMYSKDFRQYLCCNRDSSPIGTLVECLYSAIKENSKHPKIRSDFQYVIDAYMQNDIGDDDDDLPF